MPSYRVYGTYSDHAGADLPDGTEATNSWQMARGGFRVDGNASEQNSLTVQGDGYVGWIRQTLVDLYSPVPPFVTSIPDDWQVHGADVLGRWTHTFSDTSDVKLQAYYDYTSRKAAIFDEERRTFDLSLQHEFALGGRNKVVWGLGYHVTADTEQNNSTISFNPEDQTVNLYSGFVQDEIALVKDRLSLTLGSKLEHNDYTGVEVRTGRPPALDAMGGFKSAQPFKPDPLGLGFPGRAHAFARRGNFHGEVSQQSRIPHPGDQQRRHWFRIGNVDRL